MRLKYLMLCVLAILVCSCTSVRHTATTTDVANSVVTFTVAELEVGPARVSMTYSWNWAPFRHVSVDLVKDNTTAELLKMTHSDVLVEPQYIVSQRGWLRGGSVTVSGYPARYKNFHTMTPDEAETLKATSAVDEISGPSAAKHFVLF